MWRNKKMREVVIVDGARTAFGRMGGALRVYTPVELAGMTMKLSLIHI